MVVQLQNATQHYNRQRSSVEVPSNSRPTSLMTCVRRVWGDI